MNWGSWSCSLGTRIAMVVQLLTCMNLSNMLATFYLDCKSHQVFSAFFRIPPILCLNIHYEFFNKRDWAKCFVIIYYLSEHIRLEIALDGKDIIMHLVLYFLWPVIHYWSCYVICSLPCTLSAWKLQWVMGEQNVGILALS